MRGNVGMEWWGAEDAEREGPQIKFVRGSPAVSRNATASYR